MFGPTLRCFATCLGILASAASALAQPGWVLSHQKVSDTEGEFDGVVNDGDQFGRTAAWLGDFDGDGVADLAVGATRDDDGGTDRGAVWILFLRNNGTVKDHRKISATEGGFTGELSDDDRFGRVAFLGDLDGDHVGDLAVGAARDDDGGTNRGAVWILFLNPDGTVKAHQKISDAEGGFTGELNDNDQFGHAVASLGDLDGAGPSVVALAVGVYLDDDGGTDRGAVWILFLNANGTVWKHQKISDTEGNFGGELEDCDYFATSVGSLGDLDGDGVVDLAAPATGDDDGGVPPDADRGAVWILFLSQDGTVKAHQKISATEGGFSGELHDGDSFGVSVGSLDDLNGDGVEDLAVGAWLDDDGGDPPDANRGAVWILFLNDDGTVNDHQKISDTEGGFTGELNDADYFGMSAASLGDLDGDGLADLAVGAIGDDDGGDPPNANRGAVWVLFLGVPPGDLNGDGCVDHADLGILLSDWGCTGGECPGDCDFDGDTDHSDLGILLGHWGEGCP